MKCIRTAPLAPCDSMYLILGPINTKVLWTQVGHSGHQVHTLFVQAKKSLIKMLRVHLFIRSYVTSVPSKKKTVFPAIHPSESLWELPDKAFGTSLRRSSLCSKVVYVNWSSPVLHYMNHTFPLLPPIFTAAVHLDLLKHFTPWWLRKTKKPRVFETQVLTHTLLSHCVCINNHQQSPLDLQALVNICVCKCPCACSRHFRKI